RFWRLSVAGAVCLFAVSPMTASAPAELILIATGVTVAIFSTINLVGTQMVLAPRWEGPGQLTAGALAGVMGGLTGVAAPPVLAFLLALKLDKEEFVRSIGLLLLLGAIPLFFGYLEAGLLTVDVFLWSVVLCLPTIIGFSLGERLRRRMDTERFQKYVLIYFLIAGANMVRQAVSA
ncbi:MAG: sulfite exporter TauE/SafE family protein, partial [Pseudomonadota bacterium]